MSILNLEGKCALVVGVTNNRSLGYHIAMALKEAGAEVLVATHPDLVAKAQKALEGVAPVYGCDVTDDTSLTNLAQKVGNFWPNGFDYLVHAVAGGPARGELEGSFLKTSRESYLRTQDISAYSLIALCRVLLEKLRDGGSVLALTFAAAHFHSVNYNIMAAAKAALEANALYLAFAPELAEKGIRVNALSAGPVKTLSSMGVGGFRDAEKVGEMRTAFGENVSGEDIGIAAAMLLAMPGLTGQVVNVDNGISCCGMGSTITEMANHQLGWAAAKR